METVRLAETVKLFLVALQAEGVAPTTLRNYRHMLKMFTEYLHGLGCETLHDVQTHHIRQWLIHKREQGVGGFQVCNCYRLPRRFWRWCIREELVDSDPFGKVSKPKVPQVVKPALTQDEIDRLLNACRGRHWLQLRDRALVILLLSTGLRAMEAHALKVKDVEGDSLLIQGKGNKQRMVPLTPQARLALKRYLLACPYKPTGDDPLWWGNSGRLTLDGLKQAVRDLGTRAGVRCGAHRLRHTFATRMLQDGASMEHVRLLLGHSDYTVLRQYLHLTEADLDRTMKEHNPLKGVRL